MDHWVGAIERRTRFGTVKSRTARSSSHESKLRAHEALRKPDRSAKDAAQFDIGSPRQFEGSFTRRSTGFHDPSPDKVDVDTRLRVRVKFLRHMPRPGSLRFGNLGGSPTRNWSTHTEPTPEIESENSFLRVKVLGNDVGGIRRVLGALIRGKTAPFRARRCAGWSGSLRYRRRRLRAGV